MMQKGKIFLILVNNTIQPLSCIVLLENTTDLSMMVKESMSIKYITLPEI